MFKLLIFLSTSTYETFAIFTSSLKAQTSKLSTVLMLVSRSSNDMQYIIQSHWRQTMVTGMASLLAIPISPYPSQLTLNEMPTYTALVIFLGEVFFWKLCSFKVDLAEPAGRTSTVHTRISSKATTSLKV